MPSEENASGGLSDRLTKNDRAKLLLAVWEKTVDVQQHFNDIEMRIRNLALTILGAVVAVSKALDTRSLSTATPSSIGQDASVGALILQPTLFLGMCVLIAAFWFMDRLWYHRLLEGAVNEGGRLERELSDLGVEIPLGRQISQTSPISLLGRKIRSGNKIDVFYLTLGSLALFGAAWSSQESLLLLLAFVIVVIFLGFWIGTLRK
jgi:hypothetical protein